MPVEFPDDLVIINNGPETIPAGTKVHWQVKGFAGYNGNYTLPALAPNKHVFLSNALSNGLSAGTPCAVTLL